MRFRLTAIGPFVLLAASAAVPAPPDTPPALPAAPLPPDWSARAPRDELKPDFAFDPKGGLDGRGAFLIAGTRDGAHGWVQKPFAVSGGRFYRFYALRQAAGVAVPRKSVYARILWRDTAGKPVKAEPPDDEPDGPLPTAEPEYPPDAPTKWPGYVAVEGVYRVPAKAAQAVVELHLHDAPKGSVTWSDVSLQMCEPPAPRKVRLAAVHFKPSGGKTPLDNCKQYAPLIAEAAKQKADLVVLGETITYVGLGKSFAEVAESVPGYYTEYFGTLAKQHNLYIVAGLVEREKHLLYNVAVLIGPSGDVVGKYRKVCIPRGETEGGITAGRDYPVFDTRFGRVGMMVCYDGFFPEVARELTNRGAEVIAWPVWGCNPLLAAARACENHTYLVSITYTDVGAKWTRTAV